MSNNSRIAKNTLFLYLRMLFLLFLGLYTSRVTLAVLGVEDYGIYSVVGGIVTLFMFFNSALTAGVQRFLNFYIGEDDNEMLKKVFSFSMHAFIVLTFIIVLLSETAGVWLLEKYMVIPEERMTAARIIYQFSILQTVFSMLKIPFNATIIAYEKMNFYAYVSIVEGVMKLLVVWAIQVAPTDKLILYAALYMLISVVLLLYYYIYCKKNFSIINFKKAHDKELLRSIMSFSGWNILGSAGTVLTKQGVNILLNRYFGVYYNAAMGAANQVYTQIYNFLMNFQTAFNPQIVKSYARGEKDYLWSFVIRTSKYSFFLMYFIILPFVVNMDFVLGLWLEEVPFYTNVFTFLLCVFTLIDSLSGPLWMLVEAEGNIKKYQIVATINSFLTVVIIFVAYFVGMPAYIGQVIQNLTLFIFMIWRLFYLKQRVNFPLGRYVKEVLLRLLYIIPLSAGIVYGVHSLIENAILRFFVSCTVSVIVLALIYWFLGTEKEERGPIVEFVKRKIKK